MSVWLDHLVLNALGLSLLGLLAWTAIRSWRREATTAYRFLVLVLVLAVFLPGIQLLLLAAGPVWSAAPTSVRPKPEPASPPAHRTVQVEVEVVCTGPGAPWTDAELELPPMASTNDLPAASPGSPGLALPGEHAQLVLFAYLAGVLIMAVFQGARLLRTTCFLAQCRPLGDPLALSLWHEVGAGSPLRDRVRLLTSDAIHWPCCWGLLRPYLVLPADWKACSVQALRWSLRHELVHLERRDAWTALLQTLLLTMSWYHPAAWWLSRQLNWWREASCDRRVVERTGQRRSYARALVSFAVSSRETGRGLRPTILRSASPRSHLRERVQLLAKDERLPSKRRHGLVWCVALVTLGLIGVGQLGAAAALLHQASPTETTRLTAEANDGVRQFVEIKEVHSDGRWWIWRKRGSRAHP
jgi:beta-lactamase regulating signal transducer with metallopeptidase domain